MKNYLDFTDQKELITLFETSYLKHKNLYLATLNLVHSLFGKHGLLILEPDNKHCLLYTSPSPRDRTRSRMPSSA